MANNKRNSLTVKNTLERCSACGRAIYGYELRGEGAYGERVCTACAVKAIEALPKDRIFRMLGYEPVRYID